ncbi:MAG: hypothetical protein H0V43_12195 [Gemmatimonadales bacterium]|nr:hypothetical protein [Gemmatimonadales bacterium]MBA3553357.1 hypothetical protein [Gemmatimonadales bacterium]
MTRVEKNRLEWIVFAVSLVLVVATFGYLIRETIVTEESPPDVVVALGTPRPGSGGFMVPVVATNRGGQTAENVQIAVELETDAGATHESVLAIPFLPRESNRQGWVAFPSDPGSGTLRLKGVGFQSP